MKLGSRSERKGYWSFLFFVFTVYAIRNEDNRQTPFFADGGASFVRSSLSFYRMLAKSTKTARRFAVTCTCTFYEQERIDAFAATVKVRRGLYLAENEATTAFAANHWLSVAYLGALCASSSSIVLSLHTYASSVLGEYRLKGGWWWTEAIINLVLLLARRFDQLWTLKILLIQTS